MGKSLLDLANNLRRTSDKIDRRASEISKELALEIVKVLVEITPVDTSKALSNWQVRVGSPVNKDRNAFVPGERGDTQAQSATAAVENARIWLAAKKPGEPIFISNVLDYIKDLDQGSSTQFAGGFVDVATTIAEGRIKGKRLGL